MRKLYYYIIFFNLLNLWCQSGSTWEGYEEIRDGVVCINNTGKGLWQKKMKMVMEEVLSIGVEEGNNDYILNQTRDIVTDEEDNIYICDTRDFCIKVYNNEGVFLRKIGKQGQGPGEFRMPKRVAITNDNKLCVLDYQRISFFTLQGEYINSFKPRNEHFGDLTIIPGNNHIFLSRRIMSTSIVEQPWLIAEVDSSGNILKKFGELVSIGKTSLGEWYSEPSIHGSGDGRLLVTFPYPYRVDIYQGNGKKIRTIQRVTNNFTKPTLYVNKLSPVDLLGKRSYLSQYSGFELPGGYFMVQILDYGPNFLEKLKNYDHYSIETYYELFDMEGHFLQSFYWKEKCEEFIVYVDKKGFAYTRSWFEDIPRVRKYELSFVEK